VLEDARVGGGRLALSYVRRAKSEIELRSLDSSAAGRAPVALPGVGSVFGVRGEPGDDTAYYYFTSFATPGVIFELSAKTGASKPWYAVGAPVDPSGYEVEHVFPPSKDGTKVSTFVVRKGGAPRDGSTPVLLHGYGGFNASATPAFGPERFVWLELGAYSPYYPVAPGTAYPAVLMLSADADDRVAPLHAWKTAAALQAASSSGRPVLLRVERHAGHGGADQVKSDVEAQADAIAFARHAMGLPPPPPGFGAPAGPAK
jgi:prolyl oligopeptidase PreP (S9A serine peptidase family)